MFSFIVCSVVTLAFLKQERLSEAEEQLRAQKSVMPVAMKNAKLTLTRLERQLRYRGPENQIITVSWYTHTIY
jgi:hypothetical protein